MNIMPVGSFVIAMFEMTDYCGAPLHIGDIGQVVKATRSTIHVKDPRGHVHKRHRRFFATQMEIHVPEKVGT